MTVATSARPAPAAVRLRPGRDRVALVLGQVASAAGSLALLWVTARALGPAGRGAFAFFLLWPTLGSYLLSVGIPGANLKLVAERPNRTPALIGNTALVTAAMAVVLAGVLAIGAPSWLVGPMDAGVAWIAAGGLVVMTLFNGLTWIQMGLGRFVGPSLLKGIFPGAAAVVVGALALGGPEGSVTVVTAAALWTGALVAVTAVVMRDLLRGYGRPRVDLPLLRASAAFGARYQVGLVAQLVTYRADQWILGVAQGAAGLGVYSVAVSVSEVATYAATAEGMTRFRDSARRVAGSPGLLLGRVVALTGACAVVVGLAGVWLVPLVFGTGFAGAVPLLLVLLPGAVGIGLVRVCGNDLTGRGRPGLVSVIAGAQAVAMLAAFAVFVPTYGAMGAAAVSTVGYLLGGAACAFAMVRVRPPA